MKLAAAIATLILSADWALAQDVPRYDTELYCKTVASTYSDAKTKDFLVKACIELQDKSADQIKRVISHVDGATIKQCDATARNFTGGSYQMFVGCLSLNIAQRVLDGTLEISSPKK